ncbi:MAG: AzlC family ABC transporter permease [Desulfobacteraceae bacterium]
MPLDLLKKRRPRAKVFQAGLRAAWPISLGYIPIGLAFGVLAQKAGLSPAAVALMSVLVFAGSSQFIAVSMLAHGAAPAAIIMTTFVVNLRHLLMSSSLSVFLASASRKKLLLFAYGVTDESFAVNHARFSRGDWGLGRALVLNYFANLTWVISTVAGAICGQFIPAGFLGMDYALIAMFICLLVFQLKGRLYVLTAVFAGGLAVVLALLMPGNAYIVLASIGAATLGVICKRRFSL